MPFISRLNDCYWERNVSLIINICKCVFSNLTYMSNFQPLEVVDRGSETQLKVVENLNKINVS